MIPPHIILVCYPAQGHINPSLRFARILADRGADTTIVTAPTAQQHLTTATSATSSGISFAWISDGYGSSPNVNTTDFEYHVNFNRHGPASLAQLVVSLSSSGHPVDCIAYSFLLPWAADVAAQHRIPSALLWIQPASVLSIYYHFTHDLWHRFEDHDILLPGLPPLLSCDLPSFVLPQNISPYALENLERIFLEKNQWILINSFDSLEPEVILALRSALPKTISAVGPMMTMISPDLNDTRTASCDRAGDGLANDQKENNQLEDRSDKDSVPWLDSQPEGSVVYVSFGTWVKLTGEQLDEVASWLMESGQRFLWAVSPPETYRGFPVGFKEALLKQRGMTTEWCDQVRVLSHPSVGCFVTHSGWNSTLEGVVCGKPMVCVPQWSDQPTNAKFVQDVWKTGIRARRRDDGVVGKEELKRCVQEVMSEESGREIRENALQIKELARKAMEDGGSSDRNIMAFIEQIRSHDQEENVGVTDRPTKLLETLKPNVVPVSDVISTSRVGTAGSQEMKPES